MAPPTMREVCFLIGRGGAVLWSDSGEGPLALHDSRSRWEAIWALRGELEELAHSHPLGPFCFSREDETTMAALQSALGRTLRFSVVAPEGTLAREGERDMEVRPEPWWASLLRMASGMTSLGR